MEGKPGAYPALETALDAGPLDARRLAAAVGISDAVLDRIRWGGYAVIAPALAERISAALGVPADELFVRAERTRRLNPSGPAPASLIRRVAAGLRPDRAA